MWRERADYGNFFYRIPNGESAADAYDRVSGFNESLWRQFGDNDFPSVAVLVTHGLMSRVFLMKWYHWSVEYFEDLRNVGHCEFVVMRREGEGGKYELQNELRTWSELKRQRAQEEMERNPSRRNTLTAFLKNEEGGSPAIPARKWGGCVDGCDHHNDHYPRRKAQVEQTVPEVKLPPALAQAEKHEEPDEDKKGDHAGPSEPSAPSNFDGATDASRPATQPKSKPRPDELPTVPSYLRPGRDAGGTVSGENTPHEMSENEDADGYFADDKPGKAMVAAMRRARPQRKATPEDIERWAQESGMGRGLRADALGDEPEDDEGDDEVERAEREDKGLRGSVY